MNLTKTAEQFDTLKVLDNSDHRANRISAKEAEAALARLEHALKTFHEDDRITKDSVYRGLVLLCETMTDVNGIRRFFRRWEQEGPGDEVFQVEMQRLEGKFRTRFGGSGTE